MEKGKRKKIMVTGKVLKIYGLITFTAWILSLSVLQRGVIGVTSFTQERLRETLSSDPNLMALTGLALFLQILGGLAIPVYAFLLAEGAVKTRSFRAYFLRILLFAAVCEVPYDLAVSGKVMNLSSQNPAWGLVFAMALLAGLRYMDEMTGKGAAAGRILMTAAGMVWAFLTRTSFGATTVLLTSIYILLRDRPGMAVLWGCAAGAVHITPPLSGFVLYSYTGVRGKIMRPVIYYIIPPVIMLVMWAITIAMGGLAANNI